MTTKHLQVFNNNKLIVEEEINKHSIDTCQTTESVYFSMFKERLTGDDVGGCNEEENNNNDVFQHYRSSEVINKRPAHFSPETPRKRMSTSTNDITELPVQQQQEFNRKKIPTFLNLPALENQDFDFASPKSDINNSSNFLEVPSIRGMKITDEETSLSQSGSMRCYRKPYLNDRSPTTPMIRRRDDSPTGTLRKKMKVATNSDISHKGNTNLHRAYSVSVRPQFMRGTSTPNNGGGISNHHTNQLNRTFSGYFKRAPSSVNLATQYSALKRQGSFKVVSSKVNRVKRCYSTASVIKRKDKAAVCRNPSIALQKRSRRCSEPFVLDSLTLQNNKWNRKQSTANRGLGKRRLSTTAVLPTSSKHKLQALAKDELLASLNVPLTGQEVASVSSPEEVPCDITDEQIVIEESENKKQAEKDRRETKRLLIMEEILETEKNYISCLETLNAVFRSQLEGTNIISEKDLNSLFPSHLYHIKEAHMLFMTELEERMNNNDYKGIIGDIFARMTSASVNLLEIYTAYVNAFPKSISTLSKCTRSSNKFRKFLEDCYENPMVERLDLPSFLLSPVQRLPRYILLLRELLKYTDDEHPDKYFISGAMNEMELLISSLNSSIHNSMEFFSASDSRRKKMSRQLSSKKRKQRTSSTILRNSKNAKPIPENKSDNDQGYCSLGERKDESPEEETPRRKPRASAWRGKRSMSMISASSEEGKPNNLMIKGGKNDFFISNRNSDTRKSWRRSIGAVFSNLWSNRDDECQNNTSNASSQNNTPTRKSNRTSFENNETIDIEITEVEEEETSSSPLNESTTSNTNELSVAVPARKWSNQSRRKVAIVHTSPSFDGETVISPTVGVLDGNENIENINELVENTSIDDTDGPRPRSLIRTSISSSKPCNLIDSEMSSSSLKEPQSPQNLCRDGKLRRSAGPTKSFFQRSSARMQKTLSMDELNIKKYEHAEEKRKRFSAMSLNKQRSKEQLNKSNSGISSQLSTDEYTIIKSISATDTHSSSSTETISSKTSSAHSSLRDDGDQVHENNNTINGKSKEKKNKLLKTFKSFVGKK